MAEELVSWHQEGSNSITPGISGLVSPPASDEASLGSVGDGDTPQSYPVKRTQPYSHNNPLIESCTPKLANHYAKSYFQESVFFLTDCSAHILTWFSPSLPILPNQLFTITLPIILVELIISSIFIGRAGSEPRGFRG